MVFMVVKVMMVRRNEKRVKEDKKIVNSERETERLERQNNEVEVVMMVKRGE